MLNSKKYQRPKKPRILFTSLSAIKKYYRHWELNPYICFDEHRWNMFHPERSVFERNGRRYKIFKKCAPSCVQNVAMWLVKPTTVTKYATTAQSILQSSNDQVMVHCRTNQVMEVQTKYTEKWNIHRKLQKTSAYFVECSRIGGGRNYVTIGDVPVSAIALVACPSTTNVLQPSFLTSK